MEITQKIIDKRDGIYSDPLIQEELKAGIW